MNQNKTFLQRIDYLAAGLARLCIRRAWLVISVSLLLMLLSWSGLKGVEVSNNYEDFFSKRNPQLEDFKDLKEKFISPDHFYFLIQPEDGQIFSQDTLSVIEELTDDAWKIPYAGRVDSITNFQHSYGENDDLIVESLVENAASLSSEQLERIKAIALNEPTLNGFLIDAKAIVSGINVSLRLPDSLTALPEAAAAARALVANIEAKHPNIKVGLVGGSMNNNAFYEAAFTDLQTLFPLMFVVLLLICYLTTRSVSMTFAAMMVILFSTIAGMSFMGLLNYKIDTFTSNVPIIILTLAIADSIHILISVRHCMLHEGMTKPNAIEEAIRINFVAVGITSITTIIGFLSLNFSDAPPQGHLGSISAFGIGAAWLFSTTLLPALLSVLPLRVKGNKSSKLADNIMLGIANLVIRRRIAILIIVGLGSAAVSALTTQLVSNENWSETFTEKVEFRQDMDAMKSHFGIYSVNFSLPAPPDSNVSDPAYLQHLEAFTQWLRAYPDVHHVYSITDIMKRLNKNLHQENPDWYKLPENKELAAQFLLLYELSLPYGLDLTDRITFDKDASRLTVSTEDLDLQELMRFFNDSSQWLEENTPSYMHAKPTGMIVMFAYLNGRIIDSMGAGITMTMLLITLVMIIALWNVRLGLLSIIPNALPILVAFGSWALISGTVGITASLVASISLGIIVDDSVHMLSKYIRARRERELSREDSIRYAFRSVGLAILMNTVIIAIGFLVLVLSTYRNNYELGMLMSMIVVIALLLDFLLLPALLLSFSKNSKI